MSDWVRHLENYGLVRSEPEPDLEPESEPKLELEEMA